MSCDRLGQTLIMETCHEGGKLERLDIDWSLFEQDQNKEFAEIGLPHQTLDREPIFPNDSFTGTRLHISKLRTFWGRKAKLKLRRSLEKMINPFSGIDDFEIFPVSALSAKTFRLKLNSKSMTKTQERHINQNYHEYKDNGKSILKYMNSYNQTGKEYYIGNECITEYQLRRAIENTGIVEIEKAIEKITVSFEQQELRNIKKLDAYTHLEGIYSPKRRTHNRANYSGKVYWNCKKCGQVNGDNKECLYCKESNVKWVRAFD